jgi:hypothetical protein
MATAMAVDNLPQPVRPCRRRRSGPIDAGGQWVDEEVHVDNGLVTSRKPDDLDALCEKMIEKIAEGRHAGQRQTVAAGTG